MLFLIQNFYNIPEFAQLILILVAIGLLKYGGRFYNSNFIFLQNYVK